jgi:hypothetical protein
MPRTLRARGNPRASAKPQPGKRYPLNMRTTKEIRDDMEAAAIASGRTLAAEVEYRLTQSLELDRAAGGAHVGALVRLMTSAAAIIEARRRKSLSDDWETFLAVRAAWQQILDAVRPKPSPDLMQWALEPAAQEPLELPTPPAMPEWKRPEGVELAGMLDMIPPTPEEVAAYEKERVEFEKKMAELMQREEARRRDLAARFKHFEDLEGMGREIARGLLPPEK